MEEKCWVGLCHFMSIFLSGGLDLDSDVWRGRTDQLPGGNSNCIHKGVTLNEATGV